MILKISDVTPGRLKPTTTWVETQKDAIIFGRPHGCSLGDGRYVEDTNETCQAEFLANMCRKASKLSLVDHNIHGEAYHENYLFYLERCWADHLGAVITPDIVWYTILTELSLIIQADPEKHRHLFSQSEKKQKITVFSGSPIHIPLASIIDALRDKVPTNVDQFTPEFTTSDDRSRHARYAAFCDAMSPYYSYSMMCCGIPHIQVRGTVEDWRRMEDCFDLITSVMELDTGWKQRVNDILTQCPERLTSPEWWAGMFKLVECGSGSQVEVDGWIRDLFLKQPNPAYTRNFSSGVSKVEYRNLDTRKDYQMFDGLFSSSVEDETLVPRFGSVVFEVMK